MRLPHLDPVPARRRRPRIPHHLNVHIAADNPAHASCLSTTTSPQIPCSAYLHVSGSTSTTTMRPFPRPEVRTHSPASSPPPHPRHSLSPADGPLRSESQPGHPPPRQPVPPRSVFPHFPSLPPWSHDHTEELPVRLAHRVQELDQLPHNLSDMPSINKVKDWYAQSFEVRLLPPSFSFSLSFFFGIWLWFT